ncbi:MATE family efflux transporter [Virgibacillus halodenitrificans]|uniref:Probable multidrug resistance protein NorM n=1 Tax=Virgibacillus halodenitrificans TaxID=1482 RepID=A0AAC9IY80_VIRHA|nr:MATE family efflux transporter [Virgibacillus halodenitrificans]APC47388.1 MATE family efflux transporter [Virgibacillus halodenitrificans]MCG1029746.1 MATE family efflux transporter [Virgibacillus halodenitrificans]
MYVTSSLKEKLKLFTVILIPILITQVSMYMMNIFDTVMSGRASAEDLAGVAIGSSLWVPIFTGVNGILLAITPIIAHLTGAHSNKEISNKVQQGIYLSVALSIVVFIIGAFALNPVLEIMDLEPKVRHIAKYYLIALGSGLIPLFIFNTLRCFIDALGQTRISMVIILISLPLNLLFNYVFIFGKFGVPAFGGIGAGIATSITYWLVCIIALGVVYRVAPFRQFHVFSNWIKPSIQAWREQLKIGVPIGVAMFFETSIFSAVTLLMSVYSTYTIAAHQAAINFASLLYMIPLSVGMALTIAIGFELGGQRLKDARIYGYIGISGGLFIALFAGAVLYVTRDWVAEMYNSNPEVIELTKHFINYAIFFQLADAFGAPIQGALRGYKDVNVTLILALISYWIIGLPVGWILANYTSLEPFGYWVGIIVGLSCGAIALLARLFHIQKHYTNKVQSQT